MNWVFQQFVPPGARGKFKPEMMTSPLYYAEEKFDGDRRTAQFCGSAVRFTGRVISKVDGLMVEKTDNVPHLSGKTLPGLVPEALTDMARQCAAALEGTVLDGEMVCDFDGARSRDVTSIMGSLPAEAIRKQNERGWVVYRVFDCLFFKGVDIRKKPQAERRIIAQGVVEAWGNPSAKMAVAATEDRAAFLAEIWDRDGEGLIIKRLDAQYGDEKAWIKVKREVTHDVVVMGFDHPKDVSVKSTGELSVTKYAAEGLIGAIRFGQYKEVSLSDFHATRLAEPFCASISALVVGDKRYLLTYCGSTSGFEDALRKDISKDPKSYIGRVMEITAQLREESGKFRHPRFKMLRDNKTADMCIWGVEP